MRRLRLIEPAVSFPLSYDWYVLCWPLIYHTVELIRPTDTSLPLQCLHDLGRSFVVRVYWLRPQYSPRGERCISTFHTYSNFIAWLANVFLSYSRKQYHKNLGFVPCWALFLCDIAYAICCAVPVFDRCYCH